MASEIYDRSLCSACGEQKHRSMHPEMFGEYEVVEVQCMSCEALETHRKAKKDLDLSMKEFVVDVGPPQHELPAWAPNFDAVKRKDDDA